MSTVPKLLRIGDRLAKTRCLLEGAYMAGQVIEPPSERDALLQVLEEARRHLEKADRKMDRLCASLRKAAGSAPAAADCTPKH